MFKTALLAFCLIPAITLNAVEPPKAVKSPGLLAIEGQFNGLRNMLAPGQPKPDTDEVNKLVDEILANVEKIVADAAVKDEEKLEALSYSLGAPMLGRQVDDATNTPKFKTSAEKIRKAYPGSDLAALGDFVLVQWDMVGLDPKKFMARVEDYAKVYPKAPYGGYLVIIYANALKEIDLAEAKSLVEEGLKIFPKHEQLEAFKAGLSFVGKDAALEGPTVGGTAYDITDYKGKVVVIDFWATWCPPCRAMTPKLIKLYDRLHSKGLEIVGFSLDKAEDDIKTYVATHKIAWPQIFYAASKDRMKIANDFNVTGIPTLFVVGKDGKYATFGSHDFESVEAAVEKELKK